MKIPTDPRTRDELYREVIQHCAVSRPTRQAAYRRWERWYLLGTDGGTRARFNLVYSYVDRVSSLVYSYDNTRFACKLPRNLQEPFSEHMEVARDVFADAWHGSDSDLEVGEAVEWSFPYGVTLLKAVTWPQPGLYYLDPAQFGVISENHKKLDGQEAVVHWYVATRYELERYLEHGPGGRAHPLKEKILAALDFTQAAGTAGEPDGLPPAMGTVIVSAITPLVSTQGQALVDPSSGIPEPRVDIPVIELAELWLYDNDRHDYRCVTFAESAGVSIWDRPNPTLPGELPFARVCPFPFPRCFWGDVAIEKQMPLQEWRETRMGQIDNLLKLQLKPPKALIGIAGINEEKAQALNRAGGIVTSNQPGGRIETLRPEMPPDAFHEVKEIDYMSGEMGGMPSVLQGVGDAGVRAGQQVNQLAVLASARPRKRAFIIQDQIEEAATKLVRILRRQDDTAYPLPSGGEFLLSQLPGDVSMRISSHTASPLYQEPTERKADKLLKAGAIDKPTYVELLDPPMSDALRARARLMERSQAQMRQQLIQQRHEEQMAKALPKSKK